MYKIRRAVKAQLAEVWWQAGVLLFLGRLVRNVKETDRGSSWVEEDQTCSYRISRIR